MDENANKSGTQGVQQNDQAGPTSQPGAVNPAVTQNTTQSTEQASPTGPRLTLEDLYGPSSAQNPTQPQQQSSPVQPMPQSDVTQVVPAQPVQSMSQVPVSETTQVPESPVSVFSQQPAASSEQSVQQPMQPPMQPIFPVQPQQVASTVPGTGTSREVLEEAASKIAKEPVAGSANLPKEQIEGQKPGGFRLSTILRFVIGGVVAIIVLLIVWSLGSMLFGGQGNQSGKVTLTYWGLWEDQQIMQPVLNDFEKQHPNITVNYVRQDPKDYTKRLLTRVQDGSGPDVFRFHNTWVYPLQSLLLPLPTQVTDRQQFDANYPPVVSHDLVQNGAIYGLPLQMDTLTLFTNTDILNHAGASVPTTWDNFITVAKALTVKDPTGKIKTAGAAIGTYENIAHAPDLVSLLLLQNGANLNKLSPSQNANDAMTFYSAFAKGDSTVWDPTLDNSLYAFARGKVAMYFGYSFDIFAIKSIAPQLNFTTHPVPHLPGRNVTIASYWVEGVSNRSKHQKEALQLMQYLAQKDVQTKIYTEEAKTRSFGELYARTDLAEGLKANPLLAPFVSQYKDAQSSFFAADTGYDEYNGSLNRYLGNAINSMVQDTSVDSAMQTLSQGVTQVMNTYAPKTP